MPVQRLGVVSLTVCILAGAAGCITVSTWDKFDLQGSTVVVTPVNMPLPATGAAKPVTVSVVMRQASGASIAGVDISVAAQQCVMSAAKVPVNDDGAASVEITGCPVGQQPVVVSMQYAGGAVPVTSHTNINAYTAAADGGVPAGTPLNAQVLLPSHGALPKRVHFVSTDSNAVLPGDYALQPNDRAQVVLPGALVLQTLGTQSVSALDADTLQVLNTDTFQVSAVLRGQPVLHVALASTVVAGQPVSLSVTAQDSYGNTVVGFVGTVQITSSDANAQLPAPTTLVAANQGATTLSGVFTTAGPQTLTVRGTGATSSTVAFQVQSGPATWLQFASTGNVQVDALVGLQLTARDAYGNVDTQYAGYVLVTTSDSAANIAFAALFTPSNAGAVSLVAQFETAGSQSVHAVDAQDGNIVGDLTNIDVTPASPTHLVWALPTSATAGVPASPTLTVADVAGNPVVNYTGYATVTCSDVNATFSASVAFTTSGQGVATVPMTLVHAGSTTLTATDASGLLTAATGHLTVAPAAANHLLLMGSTTAVAGSALTLQLMALDAYGNTATGYTGTVHFTTTDGRASLPPDTAFTASMAGSSALGASLSTAGLQSIVVTDTQNGALTAQLTDIAVIAGAAAQIVLTAPSTSVAGQSLNSVQLTVEDTLGNAATTYTGTLQLSSNDPCATLPSTVVLQGSDAGSVTLANTVILRKAATIVLGAVDQAGKLTAASAPVVVSPASANKFAVTGLPASMPAGLSETLNVITEDAFGNTVPTYTGTVGWQSSDPCATLPGNYAFQPSNAGAASFNVTLRIAGNQNVTVQDTGNSALRAVVSTAVQSGAAASLALSVATSSIAGQALAPVVRALDAYGNNANSYVGTVAFTSTDTGAGLPPAYTFLPGDHGQHTLALTLVTSGNQNIVVTDSTNASLTNLAQINVSAASMHHFLVTGASGGIVPNLAWPIVVTAKDTYGNTQPTYAGTVQLTSSDTLAQSVPNYTYSAADAGAHTFNFTFGSTGMEQILTAKDTHTPALNGNQSGWLDRAASLGVGHNGEYMCAIFASNRVSCWGSNYYCQLGEALGNNSDITSLAQLGGNLPAINMGTGRTVQSLALGADATCALRDDGTVVCWGNGGMGATGSGNGAWPGCNASEMGDNLVPVSLGTGRTGKQVAAGAGFGCVVMDNGGVKCWGTNASGQLGLGDTLTRGNGPGQMGNSLPSVSLGTSRTATQITAGNTHVCVIMDNGLVKCWGNNDDGELGIGDTTTRGNTSGTMGNSLPVVALGTNRTAIAINAGLWSTCALLDNHQVKCWGGNWSGEEGMGDTTFRGAAPGAMGDSLPYVSLGTGRTATQIVGTGSGTCALLDNRLVKCWGWSADGSLGYGDTNNRGDEPNEMGDNLPAIALGTGRTALSLGAAENTACAVLDTQQILCWGANRAGQVGIGNPNQVISAPMGPAPVW